jgi:hypothetical protein
MGFGEIVVFLDCELGVADSAARFCGAIVLCFGPKRACETP